MCLITVVFPMLTASGRSEVEECLLRWCKNENIPKYQATGSFLEFGATALLSVAPPKKLTVPVCPLSLDSGWWRSPGKRARSSPSPIPLYAPGPRPLGLPSDSLFLGDLQVLPVALQGCYHLPQLHLGIPHAAVQVSNQLILVGNVFFVPFQHLLQHFLRFLKAPFSTATGQHWEGKQMM